MNQFAIEKIQNTTHSTRLSLWSRGSSSDSGPRGREFESCYCQTFFLQFFAHHLSFMTLLCAHRIANAVLLALIIVQTKLRGNCYPCSRYQTRRFQTRHFESVLNLKSQSNSFVTQQVYIIQSQITLNQLLKFKTWETRIF